MPRGRCETSTVAGWDVPTSPLLSLPQMNLFKTGASLFLYTEKNPFQKLHTFQVLGIQNVKIEFVFIYNNCFT